MRRTALSRKKMISWLLVLAMLLTCFSGNVMAEEEQLVETEMTETASQELSLPEADLEPGEVSAEAEEEVLSELPEMVSSTGTASSELELAGEEEIITVLTNSDQVDWAGAFNLSPDGNNITSVKLPVSQVGLREAWSCLVSSDSAMMEGSYAGQIVLVDGYLYTTGTSGLVKVDQETGEIMEEIAGIGSQGHMYYDYLAYGGDRLFVATLNSLAAYDLDDLEQGAIWSVEESFGFYHPLVYHNDLLYCNGRAFKATDGEKVFGLEGTFNWSVGAFVTLEDQTEAYYVSDLYNLYAVKAKTGELIDQFTFYDKTYTGNKSATPVSYSADNNRLYWGSYKVNELHSIQIDLENGKLLLETELTQDSEVQKTSCAPVIYRDRVYLATRSGEVYVYDADNLDLLYQSTNNITKIQSTPILCTAYEAQTNKVYLLMQSYQSPGALYVLEEDYDDSNEASLQKLATPSVTTGLPYAFEQLAFDPQGALYCYNESGNFFKFQISASCLNSLEVTEALNQIDFASSTPEYRVVMAENATKATVLFTLPAGTDCLIKAGEQVITPIGEENVYKAEIPLTSGNGQAQITVTGSDQSQFTYTLNFTAASDNARLSGLTVRTKGNLTSPVLALTPSFAAEVYEYTAAKDSETENTYDSIWPVVEDSQATVKVTAVSGVSEIVADVYEGQAFYNVYFSAATAVVKVEVLAEDGKTSLSYQVSLQGGKFGGGGSSGGSQDSIRVTFSLQGDAKGNTYEEHGNDDYEMWIEAEELTLYVGDALNGSSLTVMDVLDKALNQSGMSYEEEDGYVVGINGLNEFDNGINSGWMYQVNGQTPVYGLAEWRVYDGDEIFWFYVRDYTKESEGMSGSEGTSGEDNSNSVTALFEANVQKGAANYIVTEEDFTNLLTKAKTQAQADQEILTSNYLEFDLQVAKVLQDLVKYYELKFPTKQFKEILANQTAVSGFKFGCEGGYLALLNNSLSYLQEQNAKLNAEYLSLRIQKLAWDSLTPAQQKLVDNKALIQQYQLVLGSQEITVLSGGTLDLGIPYIMPEGKNLSSCYLYRLTSDGLVKQLVRGYDPLKKQIYFQTDQPGTYVLSEYPAAVEVVEVINEIINSSGALPENPVNPQEGSNFQDIAGNPYESSIISLEKAGLVKGDGKGNYHPDQELVQAMLGTVLANHAGVEYTSNNGQYYTDSLNWAAENGIITNPEPDRVVTKEDLAATLYNYIEYNGQILSNNSILYNDILAVTSENRAKVTAILAAKVMSVDAMGNFNPLEPVNRALFADILQRLLDNLTE